MIRTLFASLLLACAGCAASPRIASVTLEESGRAVARVQWGNSDWNDYLFVGLDQQVAEVWLESGEGGFVVHALDRQGQEATLAVEPAEHGPYLPEWRSYHLDGLALLMREGKLYRFTSEDDFKYWCEGRRGWWTEVAERSAAQGVSRAH